MTYLNKKYYEQPGVRQVTRGSKRFGKARVQGCLCDFNFTCGPCLTAVAPYHNMPSTLVEQSQVDLTKMPQSKG